MTYEVRTIGSGVPPPEFVVALEAVAELVRHVGAGRYLAAPLAASPQVLASVLQHYVRTGDRLRVVPLDPETASTLDPDSRNWARDRGQRAG